MTEFFTHFHFLRPLFLLGLLTLPLLAWILKRKHDENSDWSNAIAPDLLAHLMPERKTVRGSRSSMALLTAIALTFIALSGPTWEKKPLPVVQIKDDVVVILDLSISMLATDFSPNRLTRAKQKLQDLLAMRTEGNTALIAFSGDSHIVTPLSDDSNTLLANLPALDPFMMPVIGSRPDLAVEQAVDILERGKANRGRIVLITDGVEAHQAERIEKTLPKERYTLSILAVGTAPGAPIDLGERGYLKDDGNVVIPKTNLTMLSRLAKENGGEFSEIELTDTDLNRLDINGSRYLNDIEEENESGVDKRFDAWEDLGYWLLVAVVPLLLFSHRQGALLIALLLIWPHDSVLATENENQGPASVVPSLWDDLWLTRDQQAQALMNEKRYAEAASLFESPEHKAEALYRAQQYDEAASVLANTTTSRSEYNRGNALAKAQKLEEALDAYKKALAEDPSNEDARFNKQLVEDLLAQQQEQQDQNQQDGDQNSDEQDSKGDDSSQDSEGSQDKGDQESDGEQQRNSDPSEENPQSGNKSDSNSKNDSNNDSSEQQSDSSKEHQDQNNAEQEETSENDSAQSSENSDQAQDESSASVPSRAQELDNLSDEEKQSFEQWMRRVPDDPGALLRRKFEQQSRERNQQAREKGEPLW